MRLTRIVTLLITVALPFVVFSQQANSSAASISQSMEGTVIGMEGTKYWSGFKIVSDGKEYTFVTEYKAKQGTDPTVVGGKSASGNWSVDGDNLTYVFVEVNGKQLATPQNQLYQILGISKDRYLAKGTDGKVWTGVRVR